MTERDFRKAIIGWGEDLPVWLTVLSYVVVKSAESICEISRSVRREEGAITFARNFPMCEWHAFYACHQSVVKAVCLAVLPVCEGCLEKWLSDSNDELQEGYASWKADVVSRLGPLFVNSETRNQGIDELCDEFTKVAYVCDARLTNIVLIQFERLSSVDVDELEARRMCETPSLRFVLEVLVPCIALHQESPFTLFNRAREGEWDAWDKLIELDQWVLTFPEWTALAYSGDPQRDQFLRELQAQAVMRRRPEIDAAKMKLTLAAFISYVGDACGVPIAHKKLQELFDLNAQAAGLGDRDKDLPVLHDTFAREVRRHRENWMKYMPHLPDELKRAMGRFRKQKFAKQRSTRPRRVAKRRTRTKVA